MHVEYNLNIHDENMLTNNISFWYKGGTVIGLPPEVWLLRGNDEMIDSV
jgi:hypothetical protein